MPADSDPLAHLFSVSLRALLICAGFGVLCTSLAYAWVLRQDIFTTADGIAWSMLGPGLLLTFILTAGCALSVYFVLNLVRHIRRQGRTSSDD